MPSYSTKDQDTSTTTASTSGRRDIGSGGSGFTKPVAENDRDGPTFGNAQVMDQMLALGRLGMMGGMGMFGPAGLGMPYLDAVYGGMSPFLDKDEEKWGEVEQTTVDTLEQSGMVQRYGEDAVLVIANGPEDMKQLDHDAEANQIAENRGQGAETVVLWNPSPDALSTMLKEGGFKDVVFSGHGEEGVVYMTGADGEAVAVDGSSLADMFDGSEVENVFLNVCHGLGGESSVAESFAEAGMNVMGWEDKVSDGTAQQGAGRWAEMMADGSDMLDLFSTAAAFDGLSARLGNGNSLFPLLFGGPKKEPEALGPSKEEPLPKLVPPEKGPLAKEAVPPPDLFDWNMGGLGWL